MSPLGAEQKVQAGTGGVGWPPDGQARPAPCTRAPIPKVTAGLPVCTQAKFIAAARAADHVGMVVENPEWHPIFTPEELQKAR